MPPEAVGEPPSVPGLTKLGPAFAATWEIAITKELAELEPQLFTATTVILPETALHEKLTAIVVVPAPEVIVAPEGKLQL